MPTTSFPSVFSTVVCLTPQAVGAELVTGESAARQFLDAPTAVIATAVLFSLATLQPVLRGANLAEAFGPLTPAGALLVCSTIFILVPVEDFDSLRCMYMLPDGGACQHMAAQGVELQCLLVSQAHRTCCHGSPLVGILEAAQLSSLPISNQTHMMY